MGNKNSVHPINKNEIKEHIECPICLENTNNYITLKCGHSFDIYCIQMHIYNKYLLDNDIQCPYCRENIDNNTIVSIFKKWNILITKTIFILKIIL